MYLATVFTYYVANTNPCPNPNTHPDSDSFLKPQEGRRPMFVELLTLVRTTIEPKAFKLALEASLGEFEVCHAPYMYTTSQPQPSLLILRRDCMWS